ncbi:response regulator transcription factor [Paraburkholderia sp. 32]|uniref:response regulator transcription factor n=1 Tax=Paraburkholderia sp. 32 TaxID=2991057 RepID=UPI003D193EB2
MNRMLTGGQSVLSSRPQTPPPTVYVVDDDIAIRESIESLLNDDGFTVKSFVSASAFLEHPYVFGPGCLLLDIVLPGLNGLELQKSLAMERPEMPIIFITGLGDAPTVVKAMKAGAVEFLTKPFDDVTLLGAIRAAIERSKTMVRSERRKATIRGRYRELTRREREVFLLVLEGLLNREVGEILGISEITVKAHRGQVMRKMEADSLAELVQMAGDAGISKEEVAFWREPAHT